MNPSSTGWINKLFKTLDGNHGFGTDSDLFFYTALRACGFIYGSNIDIVNSTLPKSDLSDLELSKVNLLLALYQASHVKQYDEFINLLNDFYREINVLKPSVFSNIFNGSSKSQQLEKVIHKRVQIDDNLFTKNFNYFVINALLYVDVLAFQHYQQENSLTESYTRHLEGTIETLIYRVLMKKERKTEYDKSLIKLFQSSLRYQNNDLLDYDEAISYLKTKAEKWYLFDLACMTTWSDQLIDEEEARFLNNLAYDLDLSEAESNAAITTVNLFYSRNSENISLLSSRNVVKNFYGNANKMVSILISRNKKRLSKELRQSKELVWLISQSTIRDLEEAETKRLQEQLLDIIKTIPSLAIFMLPGGALLLPLFIKFIPKLLPSAFDDNRIDD